MRIKIQPLMVLFILMHHSFHQTAFTNDLNSFSLLLVHWGTKSMFGSGFPSEVFFFFFWLHCNLVVSLRINECCYKKRKKKILTLDERPLPPKTKACTTRPNLECNDLGKSDNYICAIFPK
jgi:hypothetical protein